MDNTMILAIGNAGGNIVDVFRRDTKHIGLKDARYVFADCDEGDLKRHGSEGAIILLEHTNESFPERVFKDAGRLVIVAGLGSKTGTRFAKLAAQAAIDAGVGKVAVIATTPFIFEGENRVKAAVEAADSLAAINRLNVSVFNNEELMSKYPDLNFFNAFETADKEIGGIISNLK